MKTLTLILCLTLVSGFAFSQWVEQNHSNNYHLKSVCFTDENTGYAVGMNDLNSTGIILKTIDGGTTWTTLLRKTIWFESVFFTDSNTGYAVGNEMVGHSCGIILKTIDGGKTWESFSSESGYLSSVFFTDANTGYVGAGNAILKTTNGGEFPTVVKNVTQESTFTVYPNPATNKISIENKSNQQGKTTLCIFNMNGAVLQQDKFQSQNLIEMDVSAISKGIYLLQIQTNKGIETKKLVVQ